jgi:cobalt-zinc-cadmium efflux system protein
MKHEHSDPPVGKSGHDHAPHHKHEHDSGHDHAHGEHGLFHSHQHTHAPVGKGRAFAIGIVLNLLFVIVEFSFGFASNSMALIADAGHNLSDVLGLILAWGAYALAARAPSPSFTYGLKRTTILAAVLNAVILLVGVGGIFWETIRRMAEPPEIAGGTVMAVAGVGVCINAATAFLFMAGRKDDLNVRGAYLHMLTDALVSLGVVVSGAIILATGWSRIDAAVSLLVGCIIIIGTWGLLKDSVRLALDAVPSGINVRAVESFLMGLPGVIGVHHLHVWGLSTTETALTAHLVMPEGLAPAGFLESLRTRLRDDFKISHVTIQVESHPDSACASCGEHVPHSQHQG